MFWQMVKGALIRQRGRFILIALTVALGVSLATAMLNVMFDIGEKVNQELKAFGANITVTPRNSMVLKDLYGVETTKSTHREYLEESDLGNIKTIFWTNNIVAFSPSLTTNITLADGETVPFFGTWFEHTLTLPTDEVYTTGVKFMKSWWHVDGDWADDAQTNQVLVGTKLAQKLGVSAGSTLSYKKPDGSDDTLTVTGILSGGGDEENQIVGSLALAQNLANAAGKIDQVEVSAMTTPENDLARKAAENPKSLSQAEYDIWYCTSYVGSIAYQIEEVMQNAAAHPVRQIAESEGKILDKTQLLMLLITVLSLLSSSLGVSNLISANIMERSRELGLLKALGATNLAVVLSVLAEIFIAGIMGGILGYVVGLGFAQLIGENVFGSGIAVNPYVIPIIAVLMSLVLIIGSVPAIRMLLSLQPAEVLYGR
ncbi:ABC transporter permease [Selenomonas sp. oral taxon 920]|uniref:ABC transporter permease n=1 Tax=Selenomonas sp. oral taxon 920 TaxID=1884263 RepID=UPI000840C0A0|nr:ABC transporter permease [Selenomonas sp. oral taxon 920]AOH47702.1 ABC transporter permease [Selenomonas sp. oral taxon 920]